MSFASFAMQSLLDALGVPSTKVPIDGTTFVSYVLPPLVFHFVVALLAVTPQTRIARIALWPLVALLALRAALSMDFSFGKVEQRFNSVNFMLLMLSIAARTLDWALAKGPLVRHLRPANSSPSTIFDALDLVCNFRGLGWDWSRYRSYIPRETRPTTRMAFVLYALLSGVLHALICGTFHRAVITLAPMGRGSTPETSTIFDDTLPFPLRYLRASVISTFTAVSIYSVMQMGYDFTTVPAVLFLRQDPAQWPPAFNAPWRATSLSDLWGRRWHQFFRHTYLLGGYPLSFILGRPGILIGAFLSSALWHHITLIVLHSEMEAWWMFVGFGMMAPGMIAESTFQRVTGRRVGGVFGWMWTMGWLLVWGNVIVEGFARGGIFSCSSPMDSAILLRAPVERLVVNFDAWLHGV